MPEQEARRQGGEAAARAKGAGDPWAVWRRMLDAAWSSVTEDPKLLGLSGAMLEAGFELKRDADQSLEAVLAASRLATKGDVERILLRLDAIEERLIELAERMPGSSTGH